MDAHSRCPFRKAMVVHLVASALMDRLKVMVMTVNLVATVLAQAETAESVSAMATMVARVSELEQEERVYQ